MEQLDKLLDDRKELTDCRETAQSPWFIELLEGLIEDVDTKLNDISQETVEGD